MPESQNVYEPVIGLEVHAQLLTNTKAFCGCSTKFGSMPNSNVCPVCLGHPGVLPVLNGKVVEFSVLMGLATQSTINEYSVFARKNYFYPDLPKGYQISQYDKPICEFGKITIELKDGTKKDIGITRIHMEEDAGKSIHDQGYDTLVDVNRCGVPLIEIVSEPDIRSAEEAGKYLQKIRQIVRYLGICDGNMEEGSLRCDANISVRLKGAPKFGTKTEVKNMNSFRNVEKAIAFEIERQIDVLESGGKITQQTMLWNADLNEAIVMRSKEEAHDYRYFPEPDLMPVHITEEIRARVAKELPELPEARRDRFITQFGIPQYDAEILTSSRELADYYEAVVKQISDYKSVSNWVMGEVLKVLNEQKIDITEFSISPERLAQLLSFIQDSTVSGKIAKDIFSEMLSDPRPPVEILNEKGLRQISDSSELQALVDSVLGENPEEVEKFLEGKEKVFGFLIGKIMKASKGKANPGIINSLLKQKLDALKK